MCSSCIPDTVLHPIWVEQQSKLNDKEKDALNQLAGCSCCSSTYPAADLFPEIADAQGDICLVDLVEAILRSHLENQKINKRDPND